MDISKTVKGTDYLGDLWFEIYISDPDQSNYTFHRVHRKEGSKGFNLLCTQHILFTVIWGQTW